MKVYLWESLSEIEGKKYTCGYCGCTIGPNKGYYAQQRVASTYRASGHIFICTHCEKPTFFDVDNHQYPRPVVGATFTKVPELVNRLYEEAKRALSVNSPTAVVMCCRKVLMHIAVELGAKTKGLSFAGSVDYLHTHHYINDRYKKWVEYIKDRGNDANHEISVVGPEEAIRVLFFTEMLLKMIYEYAAVLEDSDEIDL